MQRLLPFWPSGPGSRFVPRSEESLYLSDWVLARGIARGGVSHVIACGSCYCRKLEFVY